MRKSRPAALQKMGFQVDAVSNGRAAVAAWGDGTI